MIVRSDRIEPSKNLVRGFLAFDLLLESRPDLRGRVVFVAMVYASRQGLAEYLAYANEVEQVVDRVNERWATADWQPIVLDARDDYTRTVAGLERYDVLLVNPLKDGMNLVAKEGPLLNQRDGVVCLSREAGAFDELAPAVEMVHPFDLDQTAAALASAIDVGTRGTARSALGSFARSPASRPRNSGSTTCSHTSTSRAPSSLLLRPLRVSGRVRMRFTAWLALITPAASAPVRRRGLGATRGDRRGRRRRGRLVRPTSAAISASSSRSHVSSSSSSKSVAWISGQSASRVLRMFSRRRLKKPRLRSSACSGASEVAVATPRARDEEILPVTCHRDRRRYQRGEPAHRDSSFACGRSGGDPAARRVRSGAGGPWKAVLPRRSAAGRGRRELGGARDGAAFGGVPARVGRRRDRRVRGSADVVG